MSLLWYTSTSTIYTLTNCSDVDVDPALHEDLGKFLVAVGDRQVQPGGPQVLLSLDAVQGRAGEALEQDAGDPRVEQGVANY